MKREPGHDGKPRDPPADDAVGVAGGRAAQAGCSASGERSGSWPELSTVTCRAPCHAMDVALAPVQICCQCPIFQVSRSRPQSLSRSSVCAPEVTMCTTTSSAFGHASRDAASMREVGVAEEPAEGCVEHD